MNPLIQKMQELLDDPRSGLKDSSDTNKTRYAILAIVEEALIAGGEETVKAFGGCTNCYGKGYSTVREIAGTPRGVWPLDPYIPCPKCDRGKQIVEMKAYLKNEVMRGKV